MTPARACSGLLLAVLAGSLSAQDALADPTHKARRSLPAHPSRTAPDVTATITKPASPPAPVRTPAHSGDNEVPPPFKLPNAPRTKVRACGATWRDMKLAGTTGDDDWRDFALKCLVDKGAAVRAD